MSSTIVPRPTLARSLAGSYTEPALCALETAQSISILCAIKTLAGHPLEPAVAVLVELLRATAAMVEALLSEGEPA